MKKVTLVLIIGLIQICNLNVKGNGFEIQNHPIEIVNLEQSTLFDKKESKYDTVQIQTSAKCNDCKDRLEHDISFEKGVKSVELDNDTKILTIVFRKDKTTVKELKTAVTKVGYDADEMLADQKAHDKLPGCCQKDVDPH